MVQLHRDLKLADASGKTLGQTTAKPKDAKQRELYKACMDFEAVMTKQMLTAMQGSTPLFGKGFGGEYFQDMFQDELSKNISQGIGLGDMLYRQLSKSLTSPHGAAPQETTAEQDSQIKTGK